MAKIRTSEIVVSESYEVVEVVRETFAAKPAVIDVNIEALRKGYELGKAALVEEPVA